MKQAGEWLLYAIASPLIFFLSVCPGRWSTGLGKWLGRLAFYLDGKHRKICILNLKMAFPGMRSAQRWDLARRGFENIGKTFLELPSLARLSHEEVASRVRYRGEEDYKEALASGKGIFMLTGHIGNWELMALAHSMRGYRLAFVARPLDNRYFDRWINGIRTRCGNRVIEKRGALRRVYRALREGFSVGLLMDQRVTGPDGVFVDFFGMPAGSSGALGLLASRTGALVLPAYIIRDPNDMTHELRIDPPVPVSHSGNREKDVRDNTQRIQKVLEGIIRENPEQWFWMHRRWRGTEYVTYHDDKERKS